MLKLNVVGKIPEILLDNTDRNRTSPFAFTGNKFEVRAVGSTANCGEPMMVLNMIVAQQLAKFKNQVDALIEKGLKKDEAILNVLRDYIKESKHVIFEGDGYSQDWVVEAEKRGLRNLRTSAEALRMEVEPQHVEIFTSTGVLTERELIARNEIKLEKLCTNLDIEAKVLSDLSRNHIVPVAINYQNRLISNVRGLKDILSDSEYQVAAKEQINIIKSISSHISLIKTSVDQLLEKKEAGHHIENIHDRADFFTNEVKGLFEPIRESVDELEMLIDDELWPLAKYRELLFTR
jgi:glutamine synthetase